MRKPSAGNQKPAPAQHPNRVQRSHVLVTAIFVCSALSTLYSISHSTPARQAEEDSDNQQRDPPEGLSVFQPGEVWYDTAGGPIQAHGGGIMYHNGLYYWYGENKRGPTYLSITPAYSTSRVDIIGISCYSSPDLIHWHYEGLVLKAGVHPDLAHRNVAERPKVVYNAATHRFVMWLHVDTADYELARTGVAVSSSPMGPFRYQGSFRPHGQQARDMTVFKDENGTAYLLYTSEDNLVMHVSELTEDYLAVRPRYARILVNLKREAPAVFKHAGLYFLLTSACTGWTPNSAEVFYSDKMLGNWKSLGNPCTGATEMDRTFTYFAQPTHVLPLPGWPGSFIFMADQWDSEDLAASRYVWLPMWVLAVPPGLQRAAQQAVAGKGRPAGSHPVLPPSPVDVVVRWQATWQLSDLQNKPPSRYEEQAGSQIAKE